MTEKSSIDPKPHSKQLYSSNHYQDEVNSLFGKTMDMSRHNWLRPLNKCVASMDA